jgi:hypothetical protein
MDGYKQSMTDGIFEGIVDGAVGVVVRGWEKALMGMRFTEVCFLPYLSLSPHRGVRVECHY